MRRLRCGASDSIRLGRGDGVPRSTDSGRVVLARIVVFGVAVRGCVEGRAQQLELPVVAGII